MKKSFFKINELKHPNITYGFFTRLGGCSNDSYESLNCSYTNGDNYLNVKKNIQFAKNQLNLDKKKLKFTKQIHSNIIKVINKKNFKTKTVSDGLLTNDNSIALGVLTADCAPIFIFDRSSSFICCLHSGWKGTLLNIVSNSINSIKNYNSNLNDLIAIVGPCLGGKNFEVSKEFKNTFIKKNFEYRIFFEKKNQNKDLFDMRGLINFQFKESGISNVYNIDEDTYQNDELFFSHRRSTHNDKFFTGRMINIISFN